MAAAPIRRSPVHDGVVAAVAQLTPRMRRITLRCAALHGMALRPAQDVELLLRESSGRRVKRRYTIRAHRDVDALAELDLDVVLHGEGAGAGWARDAQPGDAVQFQGPRGKLELRPAPLHLLVGDESALPAIAAISAAIGSAPGPDAGRATALIEVADASDELPVAADTTWVHRGHATSGGVAAGGAELLSGAVRGVDVRPGTRAYLLGESRAMITLRGVVQELGVAHDDVFVKGYWNLGRPDRLAGRTPA